MKGRALGALLLLGALAAAQETKRYATEDGAYTIDFPATWKVETRTGDKAVLRIRIGVPGIERPVYVDLYALTGVVLAPPMQARYEAPTQVEKWKATSHELGFDPLPWLRLDYRAKGAEEVALYTYRRLRSRGVHPVLLCAKADYGRVRDAFFAAALSVRCTLPRWPAAPVGYDRKEEGGLVFLFAPGVPASGRRRVRKIVLDTQKEFVRLHGPIVRTPEEPPLVIVHALRREARALSKEAAEADDGQYADLPGRRIFATPPPNLHTRSHARLVAETYDLLFVECYGDLAPVWARRGERKLFAMHAETGRRAPTVTRAWYGRFRFLTHPLDRLDAIVESDWTSYVDHGTAYVLYFRHGPSKYRKAFEAFLATYRSTGDLAGAFETHLATLDLTALSDKAGRYLARKVKPDR